jgi:hypothetical protein
VGGVTGPWPKVELGQKVSPGPLTLFSFLFLFLFYFSFVIFAKQLQTDFKQLLTYANIFLCLFKLQGTFDFKEKSNLSEIEHKMTKMDAYA